MGGRGAKSSQAIANAQSNIVTSDELVKRWENEINRVRGENANREVKNIYDYVDSKNDRFTTIGANSKNFDAVINNAKSIELIDNDLPDGRVKATKDDIRRDLERFGRGGKNGMKMNYSRQGDEFVLSYYYGYQYRIKVR